MPSRLFVGNLPYDATEDELKGHFSQAGEVTRVFIPLDRETGRPRGFAFIEFGDPEHASAAIAQLHQKEFRDRPLVVNEARPNDARPPSPGRPSAGGSRPPGPSGGPPPPGDSGDGTERPRRAAPARPRRRGKKGGSWDEGPRKEPIPEKRRGQFFGGFEDVEEDDEDVEFENFATGLPDSDEPPGEPESESGSESESESEGESGSDSEGESEDESEGEDGR